MRSIQSHLCQETAHGISFIPKQIREDTGSKTVGQKSHLLTQQQSACYPSSQKPSSYSGTNINPRDTEKPDLGSAENRWDSEGGHLPKIMGDDAK